MCLLRSSDVPEVDMTVVRGVVQVQGGLLGVERDLVDEPASVEGATTAVPSFTLAAVDEVPARVPLARKTT